MGYVRRDPPAPPQSADGWVRPLDWPVPIAAEGNESCCFAPERHAFPQPQPQ
jgi:hypothetical protein